MSPNANGSQGRWVSRPVRDTAVVSVALALTMWEVTLGGARAAVLSFLGAILLSPLVMAIDAKRREGSHGNGV